MIPNVLCLIRIGQAVSANHAASLQPSWVGRRLFRHHVALPRYSTPPSVNAIAISNSYTGQSTGSCPHGPGCGFSLHRWWSPINNLRFVWPGLLFAPQLVSSKQRYCHTMITLQLTLTARCHCLFTRADASWSPAAFIPSMTTALKPASLPMLNFVSTDGLAAFWRSLLISRVLVIWSNSHNYHISSSPLYKPSNGSTNIKSTESVYQRFHQVN